MKRYLQHLKFSRIIGGTGMIHILLQCQLDDKKINALQTMGIKTKKGFVICPGWIRGFENRVASNKIDHFVDAAMWMKDNSNIPSIHYNNALTDDVMTSQLRALLNKRAAK